MYKLLLSWRYLRTRFIALASIISVTLGVATLVVVNSVMAGFIDEMHKRLHGILSDIEIASPGLGELYDPIWHAQQIEYLLGDDLEGMTAVVRVPALLHFEFRGRPMTQQVVLIGIDDRTFKTVTDFEPYLMNELRRRDFSFDLLEQGYDERLGTAGWPYRRERVEFEQQMQHYIHEYHQQSRDNNPSQSAPLTERAGGANGSSPPKQTSNSTVAHGSGDQVHLAPLPDQLPLLPWERNRDHEFEGANEHQSDRVTESPSAADQDELSDSQSAPPSGFDPYANLRPQLDPSELFDPMRDHHTGIILGYAIGNRRYHDPDSGDPKEIFLIRPGDDVQITLPTAGHMPAPISENCTVVDFYLSNMHEYDSSFAFMPLSRLQSIRGMIDPMTGVASVSAIQIKLRRGVSLDDARDKLIRHFPPEHYPYVIQTWQDTQRPLLAAVNLELTILNILLFLIIAVAGFGILATFFMIVVEKTKDIGILKALGAPNSGVMTIFLSYGLSLGMVGTGVGIVLGLLFVRHINAIADVIHVLTGREVFDPTVYYFNEIPTLVSPWMILGVSAGAVAIAVAASVLPALRAARIHPVEALRYE